MLASMLFPPDNRETNRPISQYLTCVFQAGVAPSRQWTRSRCRGRRRLIPPPGNLHLGCWHYSISMLQPSTLHDPTKIDPVSSYSVLDLLTTRTDEDQPLRPPHRPPGASGVLQEPIGTSRGLQGPNPDSDPNPDLDPWP